MLIKDLKEGDIIYPIDVRIYYIIKKIELHIINGNVDLTLIHRSIQTHETIGISSGRYLLDYSVIAWKVIPVKDQPLIDIKIVYETC